MAYQMTVTLSDSEYRALAAEAAKRGEPLESLLHEVLVQHIRPSSTAASPLSNREIYEYLFREGIIEQIPTNEPDTLVEEAERQRLAHLFGQGKSASDMVIEDRGPR